jgi:multiple sugar transport system permease protein
MKQVRSASSFAFVAPFLLLYAFLQLYPLVRGIIISLHRVDLFGGGHFVGLANYAEILGDPVFGQAVINTLLVTLMIVPPLTVLALLLALALNNATRTSAIFRGLFFSSSVLSVTIVTLIWRFVLAPDSGLVGEALKAAGHEPLPFLSDAHLVLPAIALTTIWWSIGLPMILFLAGLQQIPADMYEAKSRCPQSAARPCSSSCCRRRRSYSCSASRNCSPQADLAALRGPWCFSSTRRPSCAGSLAMPQPAPRYCS